MACLLAGTLVSTRRGSAASAAKGANIGAASILCEAALQRTKSAHRQGTAMRRCEERLEVTLNSVPAEVWEHALKHSGRLGKRTLELVGNWTASGDWTRSAQGRTGTEPRVCSAKMNSTHAQEAREAQTRHRAVEPQHKQKQRNVEDE
ncbi:hypothetical protein ERJ75_001721400 [Trypanosoma vivax]|nr:hypothetical protein ERJ75_001721400 [Trypanosoma vivax]